MNFAIKGINPKQAGTLYPLWYIRLRLGETWYEPVEGTWQPAGGTLHFQAVPQDAWGYLWVGPPETQSWNGPLPFVPEEGKTYTIDLESWNLVSAPSGGLSGILLLALVLLGLMIVGSKR